MQARAAYQNGRQEYLKLLLNRMGVTADKFGDATAPLAGL